MCSRVLLSRVMTLTTLDSCGKFNYRGDGPANYLGLIIMWYTFIEALHYSQYICADRRGQIKVEFRLNEMSPAYIEIQGFLE